MLPPAVIAVRALGILAIMSQIIEGINPTSGLNHNYPAGAAIA
jgi:hypothetical protein